MPKRKVIEDSDDEDDAATTLSPKLVTDLSVKHGSSSSSKILSQSGERSTGSTERLNREINNAHLNLLEPTPEGGQSTSRPLSNSQPLSSASPTVVRMKGKRAVTSVEKPKEKKPRKIFGSQGSQEFFESHGGSDGDLETVLWKGLGSRAGRKHCREGESSLGHEEDANQNEKHATGKLAFVATEDLGSEHILTATGDQTYIGPKDLLLQSFMVPPAAKSASNEPTQRSESNTISTIIDTTPIKSTLEHLAATTSDSAVHINWSEPAHSDDRMPTPTMSSRGRSDEGKVSRGDESSESHRKRAKKDADAESSFIDELLEPSSSASVRTPSKSITIAGSAPHQKPDIETDAVSKHISSVLTSVTTSIGSVNPIVLLPEYPQPDEVRDELSLSVSDAIGPNPVRSTKIQTDLDVQRKHADELGSDDVAIGLPKDHYQPRPSRSRSGLAHEELFEPADWSKRPETIVKTRRKNKRRKTTAFQELMPKDEDQEHETAISVPVIQPVNMSDSRSADMYDQPSIQGATMTNAALQVTEPGPKPTTTDTAPKKQRGRPKKTAIKGSEDNITNEAPVDFDGDDSLPERPAVAVVASKSQTRGRPTQPSLTTINDDVGGNVDTSCDDGENVSHQHSTTSGGILKETAGNFSPSKSINNAASTSTPSGSAVTPPETPQKQATALRKGPDRHSPISSGKMAYRVGLSKRARIEPLLRTVRK